MAHDIILHHFDESPFSEKIRLAFGIKGLTWTSVRISRIMPRPDLMPLTGGYRRTPVLQIGADIFCDTAVILREIERRFPTPTLLPGGQGGMPWAMALWTDRAFFQSTVNLVFGTLGDRVPQSFVEDRSLLRGARFDVAAMGAAAPQMRDQFRAFLAWIAADLEDGRPYLLGSSVSLADISAYMCPWYTRSNLTPSDRDAAGLTSIFAEFPAVTAWEARITAIGHGTRREIATAEALAIAKAAEPTTPVAADRHDANGLRPGDRVTVTPDDYGKVGVSGEIVSLSAQHIALRREDPVAGAVVVHFPRVGFHVTQA